ncbi:MAG: hypothetical protein H0V79_01640 [Actinobacteria bacterium]|nr:hypothetical protein [Actinomycetota bacterium]
MATFYRCPQTGAVTALLLELDAGLAGNCAVEGRPTDQAELEEDLPQPLTSLGLSLECEFDVVVPDRALLQEHSSEQRSFAADVMHFLLFS